MAGLAPAAENAVQIITLLAEESQSLGISEISRKVDLNKNMVFRILKTLEEQGWVACHEQKYFLTLVPFQVTSKVLRRMQLNTVATPVVYDLWEKTGESTYLAVRQNDMATYIQHLDSIQPVRVAGMLGGQYPLHCSAPGKVLLAYSTQEYIDEFLEKPLAKQTGNTIVHAENLMKELELIRVQGYAVDREEFSRGIACVAAPVFDYSGKVLGAVGCSGFVPEGKTEEVIQRLKPHVTEAADRISGLLGWKKEG